MISPVSSILRASSRKEQEPLNILTCPCHEAWESNLCKTGHNFYALRCPQVKDWNKTFRPLPNNYTLLNPSKGEAQLPEDVDFDLVLSHQKFGMFQILSQISRNLHLPLISLEHTLPVPQWPQEQLDVLKSMRGDLNVFISDYSREKWGWKPNEATVIYHGLDTNQFSPNEMLVEKKPYVLSVVNQFDNPERFWCCGYPFWQEATKGLPTKHVGHSLTNWSQPAKSTADLVKFYRECTVFVDTATHSPVPSVLLEAMSCGAICVSYGNSFIPDFLKDGVNGFVRKTPQSMREQLQAILSRPQDFKEIGKRARHTIIEKFPLGKFVENWNRIFDMAKNIVYKGQ